jgi:hypothetical protein
VELVEEKEESGDDFDSWNNFDSPRKDERGEVVR